MRYPGFLRDLAVSSWRFRRALWQLSVRHLRQQTQGTLLGAGWLLVEPLFLLGLYTIVFGYLLKVRFDSDAGIGGFALYLMAGLLPFNALQQSLLGSVHVLRANRALLLHVRFPGILLPLVEVLNTLVTESIGLALVLGAVWLAGGFPSGWWFLLPLLVLVRLALTTSLVWILSILAVFIQDLPKLLQMGLTLTFFATPIIYPANMIPERWLWVERINPFFWLVSAYRAILLEGTAPPEGFWWLSLACIVLILLSAWFFDKALERAKDFL
ncbi:lipopolysaccharide transport system permease protein [Methylomarinovum tepidoasis]|uniref:Transport permease protein n=1 Tax=Methylomarinovum tepidoasis TaxID=2840183 RepID=A0AAU9BWJ3_9GAMM|nr:ABC transporter permease [Methylomarinovum sp. IN45]BCX87980.1 lipopolysaccharide transport system permease protein [Methylomarinovum sp. IN45]